jgi:hyperosmotically inducible periplasmic protein
MERSIMNKWFAVLMMVICVITVPSCKTRNKDGDIQTAFNSKAQTDPNLAGVSATVVDGTVTLTGSCADEACRNNAEKSVKDIDGVKKVVNNIQVAKVEISDDSQLRSSTEQVVSKYDGVQADVSGGTITIRGTIDNKDKLQQLMMDLQALHPKNVQNQLVIKNK